MQSAKKVSYLLTLYTGCMCVCVCVCVCVYIYIYIGAVKKFPELWYSTVMVGHMTTLT